MKKLKELKDKWGGWCRRTKIHVEDKNPFAVLLIATILTPIVVVLFGLTFKVWETYPWVCAFISLILIVSYLLEDD
jgi:uncharacterized membrane protein